MFGLYNEIANSLGEKYLKLHYQISEKDQNCARTVTDCMQVENCEDKELKEHHVWVYNKVEDELQK